MGTPELGCLRFFLGYEFLRASFGSCGVGTVTVFLEAIAALFGVVVVFFGVAPYAICAHSCGKLWAYFVSVGDQEFWV